MRHVILEIEEGSVTLTVASCERRAIRILACAKEIIADLKRASIVAALRVLFSKLDEPVAQVHVVLGERRMQHFVARLPKIGPDEIRALVTREARRIGSLSRDTELLGHCWPMRGSKGSPTRIAAICIANTTWQPIESAIRELDVEIASLTSIEDAIASVIPTTMPDRTAVLAISAGKARFVMCEGNTVLQSRRFMLPPGMDSDGDNTMVQVQLAMEVPRTLEYLAEQGCGSPEGLLVSHRVFRSDEDLQTLSQEVPNCVRYEPTAEFAEGVGNPGLATFGLLTRLASPKPKLRTLTKGISVGMPTSPLRMVAITLALVVGSAGGLFGFWNLEGLHELRTTLVTAETELHRVENELSHTRTQLAQETPLTAGQERLLQILNRRRPYSLLFGRLANATTDGIALSTIEFGRGDSVSVSGHAGGASRLEALQNFASFVETLNELEIVSTDGRETIARNEANPDYIDFTITLTWGTP